MSSPHSLFGRGTMGGPYHHSRFTYMLSKADAVAVGGFLRGIVPLVPDPFQLDKATDVGSIAYARYKDALFQGGPSERPITAAITCLEALFLTGEQELKHRLAQRVAAFLRILGPRPDAQETYKNTSDCYNIRSKFIHGSSLNAQKQPHADQLARVLLEYARICTLAFLQISVPKNEILKQLSVT